MLVSHRSGLVAVYMTKLDSWRVHMWGCVGRDLDVVPCWWSLYLCVGVFLWRRCCVSSPPAGGGGGGGSSWASFGVTAQQSSWGTWGFLLDVMQLAILLGFHTSLPPVGYPPPAVEVSRGVGGVLLQFSRSPLWFSTLYQRSYPFGVLRPCRVRQHVWLQFADLLLGLGWRDLCCATWFFSHVPCSSSGPAACAAFPDAGSIVVFRSPGVCPSASLVTWVGFQPFPSFSMLLLLRLLAGVAGVSAPCVRVLPLRWCLLGLKVKSPCCPSLTLGWVCFWPAVSQAFVVRHDLGFVDAYCGRWMVQVPDVFLRLTLGSSLSLPVLLASLRWLRFLLGCPPSVASLWRGLPWFFIRYWLACPHGLLCLWTPGTGHLSQVRRCSSSVPDRYVASPPLVGFAFGLSAVPLPQAAAVGFGLCGSTRLSSLLTGRCCPSPWIPLLWLGWEGSLPLCSFSSVFLWDVVTLWGH